MLKPPCTIKKLQEMNRRSKCEVVRIGILRQCLTHFFVCIHPDNLVSKGVDIGIAKKSIGKGNLFPVFDSQGHVCFNVSRLEMEDPVKIVYDRIYFLTP